MKTKEELNKEFGKRLKKLLKDKGLSQKELAKMVFLSEPAISGYIKGTSMPDYHILISIAKCFNVSVDYLLGVSNASTVTDEELKAAADRWGISGEAVEQIRRFPLYNYPSKYLRVTETFNSLVEHKSFINLLLLASQYIYGFGSPEWEFSYSDEYKKDEFTVWKLQMHFTDLIEDLRKEEHEKLLQEFIHNRDKQ